MKYNSLPAIALGIVLLALIFIMDEQQPCEKGCENIDTISITSSAKHDIVYCVESGKVLRDSVWVEPSLFEQRRIEYRNSK